MRRSRRPEGTTLIPKIQSPMNREEPLKNGTNLDAANGAEAPEVRRLFYMQGSIGGFPSIPTGATSTAPLDCAPDHPKRVCADGVQASRNIEHAEQLAGGRVHGGRRSACPLVVCAGIVGEGDRTRSSPTPVLGLTAAGRATARHRCPS